MFNLCGEQSFGTFKNKWLTETKESGCHLGVVGEQGASWHCVFGGVGGWRGWMGSDLQAVLGHKSCVCLISDR